MSDLWVRLLTCLLGVLLVLLLRSPARRGKGPIHLPGPQGNPLLGHSLILRGALVPWSWFWRNALGGDQRILWTLQKWSDQYGGFFQLQSGWLGRLLLGEPPTVVVSDPPAVHALLALGEDVAVKSRRYYGALDQVLHPAAVPSSATASSSGQWRLVRRSLLQAFSTSELREDFEVTKIKALSLASILVDEGPGVVHDLDEAARRLTLDVMGFSKLGYDFQAVESRGEVLMLRLLDEVAAEWAARRRRLFGRLAPWVSDSAAEGQTRCRILQHFIEKVLWEEISARGPPPADDVTLAAQLARLRSPPARGDPALTHERTLSELAAQLLLSHGPTAHAIAWALGCVAANRGVQDKLVAELKREGVFDNPLRLTYDMLPKLPYLDCVIRETLRLYPPMPCPATVRTMRKDAVLASGHHLPAGSEVWVDVFSMHRSPRLWRDANHFNPERWATTTTTGTAVTEAAAGGLEQRKEKQYDGLCTVEPDADAEIDGDSDANDAKAASQASKAVPEPEAAAATAAGGRMEEELQQQQQPPLPAVVAPLCNPAAYMPFGAGVRSCQGQRLAVAEVKAVVSVLLCFLSFEPSWRKGDVSQAASSSAGSEVVTGGAGATVAAAARAAGAPAEATGRSGNESAGRAEAGREEVAPLGLGLFLRPVGGMRLLMAPRKRK